MEQHDVTCNLCDRVVTFDEVFQCVNGTSTTYECVDDNGKCKEIYKIENRKKEKEKEINKSKEKFLNQFGIDLDELEKVGHIKRDCCLYYIHCDKQIVFRRTPHSKWSIVTDDQLIALVKERHAPWCLADEEYFECNE